MVNSERFMVNSNLSVYTIEWPLATFEWFAGAGGVTPKRDAGRQQTSAP
jgi:hypothetical protein